MNTLLIGYYGKGNFGDDLLLKNTYRIVRARLPNADIAVLCDTYREDYLGALLGERPRILRPGDREHFDLTVHGGGGSFFDYGEHGLPDRLLDGVIRTIGFRAYAAIDRGVRAALNKRRLSADARMFVQVMYMASRTKAFMDAVAVLAVAVHQLASIASCLYVSRSFIREACALETST